MHLHSDFSSNSTVNFLLVCSLVFCLLIPGGVRAREDRSSDSSDLNSFSKNSEGGSSSGGDPGDGIIGDPGDGDDKAGGSTGFEENPGLVRAVANFGGFSQTFGEWFQFLFVMNSLGAHD
jgi:hypothetical protein